MHSPDMTQENIARIRELFPGCVTEAQGNDGKIRLAVDFDQLRQELSDTLIEGPQERYRLDWPGKREALLAANAPIAKTLRPCREESVDFDNTKNLFIEGDNLDALKLLQETYLGKVKMIYIDPPYNKGGDCIYKDNFAQTSEEYLRHSNQKDEDGNRLTPNIESNGRFHSIWLSMIYARLKIARNLLKDDGVIFISYDDNEIENLKKICSEIFGENNFVCNFIWKTEGHTDNQFDIKINHEYVIVYAKDLRTLSLGWIIDPNTRKESNLWQGFAENSITKNGRANPPRKIKLREGFPCKAEKLFLPKNSPKKEFWQELEKIGYISRQLTEKYNITYPIRMDDIIVSNHKLMNDVDVFSGWANSNKLQKFINTEFTPIQEENGILSFYLSENGVIYYFKERSKARNILSVLQNMGTTEQSRSLLEKNNLFFSYPKPLNLIAYLIKIGLVTTDDIVLDFFAGSSTTAHAIMQLNAADGGNRQFIMVQIPEPCDENSEAYKAGYTTIAEISKERIRRAGRKILEGECHEGWNKDIGFRVLKVDTSNMADVYYTPDALSQQTLGLSRDNIKLDRTAEDLLFQVLLDWGVDLSLPVHMETIQGKTVFFVNTAPYDLMACFDDGVDEALVRELATFKPLRMVFRDTGFTSDAVKINVDQIFCQMSPDTEVKSI